MSLSMKLNISALQKLMQSERSGLYPNLSKQRCHGGVRPNARNSYTHLPQSLGSRITKLCPMTLKPVLTPFSTRWRTANRRLARERNHQAVKHRMGTPTHVPAILKLPKILPKMLLANMDMCAVDPALYRSPKAFNAVGARACGGDILFVRLIDRFVIIAFGCERLVSRMYVGVNEAVRPHGISDDRQQRVTATAANDFGYDIAAEAKK